LAKSTYLGHVIAVARVHWPEVGLRSVTGSHYDDCSPGGGCARTSAFSSCDSGGYADVDNDYNKKV